MGVKLVLYKLKYQNDPDAYNKRLDSLKGAIRSLTSTFWDEATSAVLIQHVGSPVDLASYLFNNSTLHTDGSDMLVVIDMETKLYKEVGVKDKKLDIMMALAKGTPVVPPPSGIGGFGA